MNTPPEVHTLIGYASSAHAAMHHLEHRGKYVLVPLKWMEILVDHARRAEAAVSPKGGEGLLRCPQCSGLHSTFTLDIGGDTVRHTCPDCGYDSDTSKCSRCGERPATCMGKLCYSCDHREGGAE